MNKIKNNLTIILLSVISTLLLVIVILLIVNNNNFTLSNSTDSKDEKIENTLEEKNNNLENNNNEDSNNDNTTSTNTSAADNNDSSSNNTSDNISSTDTNVTSEESLISYFESEEKLFESNTSKGQLTSKLKNSFTNIIDFIFYDKELKGYTFKDLTNTAKLKVISLALSIDNKIDSYFPDYKETIKDKYNDFKGKLALKYLEVTTNFCSKDPDTCIQAREDFNNMKDSFGFTWDLLKELFTSGSSKVKDLYDNWKEE